MKRMQLLYLSLVILCPLLWGEEGLEYTYLEIPNSSALNFITRSQAVHIIKVDPSLYEIRPVKLDGGGKLHHGARRGCEELTTWR